MEYKRLKLRDVCTVNQGLQIPISKRFKEKGKNRYFYITIQFLKGNTEEYYIENPNQSVICNKEDILVVRTGSTGLVITGVEGCFHNNFFKVKPKENIFSKYLYYCLNNKYMYKKMLNAASGTTIPDLKHSAFYDLEIKMPEYEEQKKVAIILSNLDKKIKLNTQINDNLLEYTKNFYKEFMQNLKEFKRVELGDVCNISTGGDKPKNVFSKPFDNCVPIYSNGITNEGLYGYTDIPKIIDKAVTISARGTIGFTSLRLEPYYPIVRLISLIPKDKRICAEFIYLSILDMNIISTGTTQQQLTVPSFKQEKIIIPEKISDIENFKRVIEPIYQKIKANKKQNEVLEQLRDTLLPKLMNGEIDLDRIEI